MPLHREPIRSGHVFLFGLDADVDACAATVALAQSVTVTGQASITGSFAIGNASFTPLNAPAVTSMGFSPSTLTDLPVVTLPSGANVPSAGDQSGAFVNGEMIYYPWMVANGGSNWQEQIEFGIPQSVILSYTPGMPGISQFPTTSNWSFFDLSLLNWYSKGAPQGSNPVANKPAGYQGGAVDSYGFVYPAPIGSAGTGCGTGGTQPCGGGAYPVLLTIRFFVFCEEIHQAAFFINSLALA